MDMCGMNLIAPRSNQEEVLSRINGIEGKVEIVKHAAKQWGCGESRNGPPLAKRSVAAEFF